MTVICKCGHEHEVDGIIGADMEEYARERWANNYCPACKADREPTTLTVKYAEYKNNPTYSRCKTVNGTYDKKQKTIVIIIAPAKITEEVATPAPKPRSGVCPYCHTYCYGECRA